MKQFKIEKMFVENMTSFFEENNPPDWLIGGKKGSTMDNSWFYNDHVLKLDVGESVKTDFSLITRVQ